MSEINPPADQSFNKNFPQRYIWKDQLHKVGNQLYALATSTEKEFLSVGCSLNDFYMRATEISKMSSSLINSMSGEEIIGVMQDFRELFDSMNSYVTQTEAEFKQGIKSLQEVLDIVDNIYKPISGFKKIVKTLKILGIATKIESSQLSQDNNSFVTIADDVEKLSALINSRFTDILKSAGLLTNVVQQTLSSVLNLETKQQGKVQSILDNTQSTLESLARKNESSAMAAGRISTELETITKNIGEVVSSLQFHDITRQQLEHVKEALDRVCSKLDVKPDTVESLPSSEDGDLKKIIIDTHAVCELQEVQLIDSEEKFAAAVSSIVDNLKNIATNITEMYEDVQNIAGNEDEASSSFFSKIEGGVSLAISSLKEIKDAIRELSIAMSSLTSTVGDMSRFMNDIEEISSEIELIAVNARIKAAHTGAEGAPLGVIAEAIQHLSVDVRVQKAEISNELQRIVSTVEGLHQNIDMHTEEQVTETDHLLKNFNVLLERLDNINSTVISLLGKIQKEGKMLAYDIEKVASGVTVQHEFPREIENAKSVLSSIGLKSRELLPEIGEQDKFEMLKHLEHNYTMHSERNIHKSYMTSGKFKTKKAKKNSVTETKPHSQAHGIPTNTHKDDIPQIPPTAGPRIHPRPLETGLWSSEGGTDGHFGDNVELF